MVISARASRQQLSNALADRHVITKKPLDNYTTGEATSSSSSRRRRRAYEYTTGAGRHGEFNMATYAVLNIQMRPQVKGTARIQITSTNTLLAGRRARK